MTDSLDMYVRLLGLLTVKIDKGVKAPHKAIMLLTIFDLIASGYIKSNKIYSDSVISRSFIAKWNELLTGQERFRCYSPHPWTPFWHLKNDHFWRFVPEEGYTSTDVNTLYKGQTPPIGKVREYTKYVTLEESLFNLLQNKNNREILSEVLIKNYINLS